MAEERLQKILARAGVASRRMAEQLIVGGEVRVNGKVVNELGARADPGKDRIEVRGEPIAREQHVYFVVHKPRSMVTTLHDPEGRPSLAELLQGIEQRVYPVGRLDFHTSGALLLTNDGDLAQALLHPSREVPKTYVAKLNLAADDRMLQALRDGVTLDDGYRTAPARVSELRVEDGKSWLEITINEGKNRQIHRMLEAVGARVMRLARQSFAGITSEGLRPCQLRPLERHEVGQLLRHYLPGRVATPEPAAAARRSPAVSRRASEPAEPRAARAPRPAQSSRSQARKTRAAFDSPERTRHKKGPR